MSGHTPGGWEMHRADECWHVEDEDGYRVAHVIDANGWPQNEANARLIAAAPVLLSELTQLVRLLEPQERDGSLAVPGLATLNAARAAIAKATGEQP